MGWFKGTIKQIASRFLWEFTQTCIGYLAGSIPNCYGFVKSVSFYGGATVIEHSASGWGAFTLGSFINGNRGIKADPNKNSLFQHEYGHYLQSQSVGPLYLYGYAIPSFIDYKFNPENHDHFKIEQDANKRALVYYLKNESGFDYQNNWSPKNPIDDNEWLSKIIGLRQSYANRNDISHNLIDNQKNSLESIIPFVKQLSIYQ